MTEEMTLSELNRRVSQLIRFGTVVEVDPKGRALVRVAIGQRKSNWLPVMMLATSHVKHWRTLRVGEQVVVLVVDSGFDGGVVLGSVYNRSCSEPEHNSHQETLVYEDGTKITVDTDAHTVDVDSPGTITAKATQVFKIEAGSSAIIKAPSITLDGAVKSTGALTAEKTVSVGDKVTVTNDVTAGGKSYLNHRHNEHDGEVTGVPI